MQTVDGRLVILSGKSRSGKTAYTVKAVASDQRILAWDPEDQWSQLHGWKKITSQKDLLVMIDKPGNGKYAFVPGGHLVKEFDFFAGCALYWGRYHGACTVIAEELADVTTIAKAPGNWGLLLRRGLKRGITIYAISQRWQEADKTAIGNASEIVCFCMSTALNTAYMARNTRIPLEALNALVPLEYIKFDMSTGAVTPGKLTFRKK